MDALLSLKEIDIVSWIITLFTILAAIIAGYEIIGKISVICGKPIKRIKKANEDHELLIKTVDNVSELQKMHERDMLALNNYDLELQNNIKKLTEMFIDKEINDMRWEINNFATKVAEGKPCNKDAYKHCIHTYEKYEKLLEENGLENGEVEISMQIVNETYKQKLKDGF